jgi:hypothetical protein
MHLVKTPHALDILSAMKVQGRTVFQAPHNLYPLSAVWAGTRRVSIKPTLLDALYSREGPIDENVNTRDIAGFLRG